MIFFRFQRLLGRSSFLSTGTDEHGTKVERKARENNMEPKVFCDQVAASYR